MKKLLFCLLVAGATVCFAEGPKERPARMMRGPLGGMERLSDPIVSIVGNPKFAAEIGLSDEQKAKVKAIEKTAKGALAGHRKALREATERQVELLKAEKIDEAAAMAEIDKIFEIRKQMAKVQAKQIIDIKALLTPEQVKKALEAFANRPRPSRPQALKPPASDKAE